MDRTVPPVGVVPKGKIVCKTVEALKSHYEGYAKNTEECRIVGSALPVSIQPVVITKTARHVLFIVRVKPLRFPLPPVLVVWRAENRGL